MIEKAPISYLSIMSKLPVKKMPSSMSRRPTARMPQRPQNM